jgi:hypothetical protein
MGIHFLKFLHVLFFLGIFGITIYCAVLVFSKKIALTHSNNILTRLSKLLLLLCFLALLTGTFLVYPTHFTFHTPWIQAAYLFTLLFSLIIIIVFLLRKKPLPRKFMLVIYLVLVLILTGIIHDAVTKTTVLF